MRHLADRSGVAIPGTGRHTGSSARQRWATRVRRIEVTRCNPARQLTARTVAGLYRSPWTDLVPAGHRLGSQPPRLDLVLADGQRFGSQPSISPRSRSCPAADGVIPQLEPLASDFNELASAVGPEPADVIKAPANTSWWRSKRQRITLSGSNTTSS
jgi:hypothetical protein